MGVQDVKRDQDDQALRRFTRQLIQDLRALEYMLQEGMFEAGVRRIGAEQELFLVNDRWQPAPLGPEVLERNTNANLGPELTRFNLEFNLEPLLFGGDCLRQMEGQVNQMLDYVRDLLRPVGAEALMTGILATIHLSDLTLDNMTPNPRYYALNDAIMRLRGGPGQFHIRGVDELFIKHDSIMLEGCNTSFQTHFQVAPEEFPHFYNVAQVVAAPVLAAAANSPLLFGKRLWHETRIALFQQAVDTRSGNLYLREMSPRVHFGTDWVRESVTEIFKEDISRFRVLLTGEEVEDPFDVLKRGGIPTLRALQLHNSTVYRWNRACYGILDGKPHLRIENRILPAGPSVIDAVANAAFWFGLVSDVTARYDDISRTMEFDEAKSNFIAAARLGLGAQITWLDGSRVPAPDLILEELLPMARRGLAEAGIDAESIDRYLDVIGERVERRQNGAEWQLGSLAKMKGDGTRAERLNALVAASVLRQKEGRPVHEWPLAELEDASVPKRMQGTRVEHFMSTDLFTVDEEELVELVACVMDWGRIRHILVEDNHHRLVGLVTHRNLLRYMAENSGNEDREAGVSVKEIMVRNPISVTPETPTMEAVRLMRDRKIGALPVVREGQLVGLVTERDFMQIARRLLDDSMEEIPLERSDEAPGK